MKVTTIEWTATPQPDGTMRPGFSSNPLQYLDKRTGKVVWACVKKSTGCANCYSEAIALRFERGSAFTRAQMDTVEPYLCPKEMRHLLVSKKLAGERVFLGDMHQVVA